MGRLRLKTKLVLAISGMVFVLVALFCYVYVSHRLRQSTSEAFTRADFIAKEIENSARSATQVGPREFFVNVDDPDMLQAALERRLQNDPGLNTLLQSVLAYSLAIYDAGITDPDGKAIVHTDSTKIGHKVDIRDNYDNLRYANFFRQLQLIYGPPKVYDVSVQLNRGKNERFGDIRVGISTVFLKSDLEPQMQRALIYSAAAMLMSLVLALGVSNFALRPLEAIGRRLDQMTAEVPDSHPLPDPRRIDEYGLVNTKIDRLGRQIRDVKEVFSTMKGNLDQVMGSLQESVVLFTSESRVVLVSAAAERFLGRSRDELLGKSVEDIFSDGNKLGRIIQDAFAIHQAIPQREIELDNGRRIQIALDFIAERGQRIGALLTMRDAESVRRLENELEVSQRMASIGRLTSGVAHEVKNPINAIAIHLELLREKMRAPDDGSSRHMKIINDEIHRLDRVVKTLADFNRPIDPKFTTFDIRRPIDEVTQLAAPDAARNGVTIESRLGNDPLPVNADSDLIKQALLNVVLNGVQAMGQGGTLKVSARNNESRTTIEVRDEGKGIPPEIQDKVFNLFFTTKTEGSGIGLAVSYRIMQLHGGSLSFDTKAGMGTVFRFVLPAVARQTNESNVVMTAT
jgi:PAS domain S-box-containing protein